MTDKKDSDNIEHEEESWEEDFPSDEADFSEEGFEDFPEEDLSEEEFADEGFGDEWDESDPESVSPDDALARKKKGNVVLVAGFGVLALIGGTVFMLMPGGGDVPPVQAPQSVPADRDAQDLAGLENQESIPPMPTAFENEEPASDGPLTPMPSEAEPPAFENQEPDVLLASEGETQETAPASDDAESDLLSWEGETGETEPLDQVSFDTDAYEPEDRESFEISFEDGAKEMDSTEQQAPVSAGLPRADDVMVAVSEPVAKEDVDQPLENTASDSVEVAAPVSSPQVFVPDVTSTRAEQQNDALLEELAGMMARFDDLSQKLDSIADQAVTAEDLAPLEARLSSLESEIGNVRGMAREARDFTESVLASAKAAPVKPAEEQVAKSRPNIAEAPESRPTAKPPVRKVQPEKKGQTSRTTEAPTPTSWILKSIQPDQAIVTDQATGQTYNVRVGETLGGIGKVTQIGRVNGVWSVVGTKGQIRP